MLTRDGVASPAATDDRPGYRPFSVRLARRTELGPRFVRLTFAGDELAGFADHGLDQRIKLLFPDDGRPVAGLGSARDWYGAWRALPDAARPALRTFTVSAVRPREHELDVDVVRHEHPGGAAPGPAARWVTDARDGDPLLVVGPDARSRHSASGIDWQPGTARRLLLVGDETAVPAMAGILGRLAPDRRATVLVETDDAGDAVALRSPARVDVRWLARDPDRRGAVLLDAVRAWTAGHPDLIAANRAGRPQPLDDVDVDRALLWESACGGDADFYAWLAGEAAMIKNLRRALVTEAGLCRSRVAFMGYWRVGRAEAA